MCWFSSSSWRRFAGLHQWQYKMWRDDDLHELVPRMVTSHLWSMSLPASTHLDSQRSLMRASIARYEILFLHGGLYVDCDLVWVGSQLPEHMPTQKLLAHLTSEPAPVVVTPHFMRNYFNVRYNPIALQGSAVTLEGLAKFYLNNAFIASPPKASILRVLLKHLPAFVAGAIKDGLAQKVHVE